MSKIVQPSIEEKAFNCPHCSAFTTQYWFELRAIEMDAKYWPVVSNKRLYDKIQNSPQDKRAEYTRLFEKLTTGLVFLSEDQRDPYSKEILNLHLSKCYHCSKFAVWAGVRLIFPAQKAGVLPNPDLPADIIADFEEAREIVNASPRGAAALLRLCIQKLCIHLGEKGKKIDDDIASLVRKGLNPHVQKSLDIVRVIGNEAVHPGSMNLNDDQGTALLLFELVNAITNEMISHPKAVNEMYSKLPEAKRKAIEKRDLATG